VQKYSLHFKLFCYPFTNKKQLCIYEIDSLKFILTSKFLLTIHGHLAHLSGFAFVSSDLREKQTQWIVPRMSLLSSKRHWILSVSLTF